MRRDKSQLAFCIHFHVFLTAQQGFYTYCLKGYHVLEMKKLNQIKINPVIIYLLTSLFLVFEMAVQVSPSVMTHQLMSDLHINAYQLGIMSGFYFYTYAFLQIPSGMLFDRFKPRVVISTSIIVCSLGVLAFAYSPNLYVSILARLLMGAGSAFAFLSVLVVSADLFENKYFALLVGVTQMLAAIGAMMGQAPLGRLVLMIGWRHTMVILAIVGFILSVFILVCVNYTRKKHAPNEHNMLKNLKKIFVSRQTWMIGLYAFLMWAPISAFASLWGVPYLISVFHLSYTTSTFVCSFMWLGLAFTSPVLGYWSTRIGRRATPLALAAFIGFLSFGSIILFHLTGIWLIIVLIFIAGAACSGQALSFSLITENNPVNQRATAIAINNVAVVLPGVIFQPLIGKLLMVLSGSSNRAPQELMHYSGLVFRESLSIILVGYFIAAICAFWFIKETYCLPLDQR